MIGGNSGRIKPIKCAPFLEEDKLKNSAVQNLKFFTRAKHVILGPPTMG